MITLREITDCSALVVAHPDDEILWFSSILEQVDHVIFCFMGVGSSLNLGRGRQQSLSSYPLEKISCLGLEESEVLNGADWRNPVVTDFGLNVLESEYSLPGFSETLYRNNYSTLVTSLAHKLDGFKNVFTHSPWGEYGNEEHVQVYRAVSTLQERMGFRIWFSNYCSNKTSSMMAQYVPMLDSSYATFITNKSLAKKIQEIYQRYNCWTWDNNYVWPNSETFLTCKPGRLVGAENYHIFPVNMVCIDLPKEYEQRNRFRRWWNKVLCTR